MHTRVAGPTHSFQSNCVCCNFTESITIYHRIHYTFFRYSQTDVTFVWVKLKRKRWFWKDSRCFFHSKNLISYNNKKRPSILIKCRKNAHLSNSIWTQVSDCFFHIVHINCFFVRKNCNLSKNDALHTPKKRTSHAFGIIWWCFFHENKFFLTKPIDFILNHKIRDILLLTAPIIILVLSLFLCRLDAG